MKIQKFKKRNTSYFKPVHFAALILIDAVVLAGVIIPQQSNISEAKETLTQLQQNLNDIKIEYEREQTNLEYMKTTDYKLQQGAVKYGWHYEEDTIILDPQQ